MVEATNKKKGARKGRKHKEGGESEKNKECPSQEEEKVGGKEGKNNFHPWK